MGGCQRHASTFLAAVPSRQGRESAEGPPGPAEPACRGWEPMRKRGPSCPAPHPQPLGVCGQRGQEICSCTSCQLDTIIRLISSSSQLRKAETVAPGFRQSVRWRAVSGVTLAPGQRPLGMTVRRHRAPYVAETWKGRAARRGAHHSGFHM